MSEYLNNQTRRRETLKDILRQLHAGRTVEEVKGEFAEILEEVGADEITRIEQELVDEGLPAEEIKHLCDVHLALFRESLDQQESPETIPGHPVFTFRAENLSAGHVLDRMEMLVEQVQASPTDKEARQAAHEQLRKLREFEKHYLRKENILFPYLERYGFYGPSSVMWAIHDDIRDGWKALDALLTGGSEDATDAFASQVGEIFAPTAQAMREMFYKEQKILFPAALERLSPADWAAIRAQSEEVGYAYVMPGRQWQPEGEMPEDGVEAAPTVPAAGRLSLDVGALSPEQINLLLGHLPLDVTFVDEEDSVRFFSQSKTEERIFPRSPAIIGRKVQNCHPPDSVHRVQEILNDFRAGTRDSAEFWIQMHGMFVHIRYFALRDEEGVYRGTIEVVQNITPLRALEGEKRLLDE